MATTIRTCPPRSSRTVREAYDQAERKLIERHDLDVWLEKASPRTRALVAVFTQRRHSRRK